MRFPEWSLQFLIVGTGLAALDLPLELWGFPLGLVLRVVGVVAVVVALWSLRPADSLTTRAARRSLTYGAGFVAFWGVLLTLQELVQTRGGLISPLGQVSLLAGTWLACRALGWETQRAAWSRSSRAWRHALVATLVCYVTSSLFLAVMWIADAHEPSSYPVLALLAPPWQVVPALFIVVAAARTSREQAQSVSRIPTPLALWGTSRVAAPLVLGLLLLPGWGFNIPRLIHHASSPTFWEFAREHQGSWRAPEVPDGVQQVEPWRGWSWKQGEVSALRSNEELFPEDRRSKAHQLEIKLYHGSQRLLILERELLVTLDTALGRLTGAQVRVTRVSSQPQFRVASHTWVDLDVEPKGSVATDLVLRVPFVTWVTLLSGPADMDLGGARVRGLAPGADYGDAVSEDDLDERYGRARLETPGPADRAVRLPGYEVLQADLPPDGEGLRYEWRIEGYLEFRQPDEIVAVTTRVSFESNTEEYSYRTEVDEKVVLQDETTLHHRIRSLPPKRLERTWNGKIW